MANGRRKPISLWSVIEGMQRRLEAEGLDRDVVDVAVTRGLEALLDTVPPRAPGPRWFRPRSGWLGSPVKA